MNDSLQSIDNDAFQRKKTALETALSNYDTLKNSKAAVRDLAVAENEILVASRSLTTELTHPGNFVLDIWLTAIPRHAAVLIAIELGLFDVVEEPMTIDELSDRIPVDKSLLRRIMRLLAAAEIFDQDEEGKYFATKFSHKLRESHARDWNKLGQFMARPIYSNIESLKSNDYKASNDPYKSGFCVAYGEAPFEMLKKNAEARSFFQGGMPMQDDCPKEQYPDTNFPYSKFLENADPEKIIFVDVGGGNGSVIRKIQSKNPDLVGKFVLFDMPSTVADVEKTRPPFECIGGDFFKEIPIQGAQVYHIRRCLHDWDDERCGVILKNLRVAMTSGFSRLLIHEYVIPRIPKGSVRSQMMDIVMMALTGRERDEDEWRDMLENAGLKLVKIWRSDVDDKAIIEAETC